MLISSDTTNYTYMPEATGWNSSPGRIVFSPFEIELNKYGELRQSLIMEMLRHSSAWDTLFNESTMTNGGTLLELGNTCLKLDDPLVNGIRTELKPLNADHTYQLGDLPLLNVSILSLTNKYPSSELSGYRLIIHRGDVWMPTNVERVGAFRLLVPPGFKYETFRAGHGGRFTFVQTEETTLDVNTSFFQTLAMASCSK